MDVSQWVQETIDSHPAPVHGTQPADVVFSSDRYKLDDPERRRDQGHRKRKLPPSDSSILDPGQISHSAPPKRAARLTKARRSRSIASSFESHDDTASHTSCDHSATGLNNVYQRRSRHKTRPDRYEVKPKKSKRQEKAKARKVKPRQRIHRRRADGDDTNHLVQNFEPQAGARQSRLTIQPSNVAGIFRHGRASAQIPGRGHGGTRALSRRRLPHHTNGRPVPDLTFNEMRFLQNPKELQREATVALAPHAGAPSKDRRRKRQEDEEVSAYFRRGEQPVLPAQAATSILARTNHLGERSPSLQPDTATRHDAQSFLGFGGRGSERDAGDRADPVDSLPTSLQYSSEPALIEFAHGPRLPVNNRPRLMHPTHGLSRDSRSRYEVPRPSSLTSRPFEGSLEGHREFLQHEAANGGPSIGQTGARGDLQLDVGFADERSEGIFERRDWSRQNQPGAHLLAHETGEGVRNVADRSKWDLASTPTFDLLRRVQKLVRPPRSEDSLPDDMGQDELSLDELRDDVASRRWVAAGSVHHEAGEEDAYSEQAAGGFVNDAERRLRRGTPELISPKRSHVALWRHPEDFEEYEPVREDERDQLSPRPLQTFSDNSQSEDFQSDELPTTYFSRHETGNQTVSRADFIGGRLPSIEPVPPRDGGVGLREMFGPRPGTAASVMFDHDSLQTFWKPHRLY